MIKKYDKIKLESDQFIEEGVVPGAIGFVIEDYGDGNYEVEFSDSEGVTIAQLVLGKEHMEPTD